jgi:predicted nucleic acid-binding protein
MRYFDTSVLFKVYVKEARTNEAIALVKKGVPPLFVTHLHEIEMRTAFRARAQRGEMSRADLQRTLQAFESDLASGILHRPAYDLAEIYRHAEELSALYAASYACRTLDILHIAAALTLRATEFMTFDMRQKVIAREAGLSV